MQQIFRPAAGKRKIHSSNEFELCYLRHQYFRRVKYNPTAADMVPYKRIVKYMAQRTFYTYQGLFHLVGMTLEDICSVGDVHLVNFLGLFEISETKNTDKYLAFKIIFGRLKKREPNSEDILNKNKANFTLFMKQRMEDFVRICRQKAKNIKGTRVDEYSPFYGPNPPPADLYKLLEDNELYGYKKLDMVQYRAIRKKVKAKINEIFIFAGSYYVTVPLDQRNVTVLDLAGAGLDPHESEHNQNPEQLYFKQESENVFDFRVKEYKNSSKEDKAITILNFIQKHEDNPRFEDEVRTARKLLRNMGYVNVR
jgi:hypothetical protein